MSCPLVLKAQPNNLGFAILELPRSTHPANRRPATPKNNPAPVPASYCVQLK